MNVPTHLDDHGQPKQVAVGDKPLSQRQATAQALVVLPPAALAVLTGDGNSAKGSVLTVARIAGIQAAKRTAELIPLCHQVPLDGVDFSDQLSGNSLCLQATVRCTARTGVEMEALTAVSVAALTVYDMLKALSHDIVIERIELLAKSGGRSGDWKRQVPPC